MTIQEIYDQIIAQKVQVAELDELDTDSVTGVWKLLIRVVASLLWAQRRFFAIYQIELQELVDSTRPGTAQWYAIELRKFQLGDNLVNLPSGKLGYLVLDEAKQIVKRSSFLEQPGGLLTLKAAKEDTNGNPIPLSAAELVQLKGYVERIKFAGVDVTVISEATDKLRPYINIYYNSLFTLSVVRANVEAAAKAYLANIAFDGSVFASKLEDAILLVEGIDDVHITQLTAISSQGTTNFDRTYRTRAGYIEPDTADGFELSDTLNFIAQ